MRGSDLLRLAGWLSLAIAAFHVVVIFFGAPAYRYFGAGEEIAQLAERGSWFPALLTLFVALVFIVFALYAFSGAQSIRRLPLLRTGLITITVIYLLRGLVLIPQLPLYTRQPRVVATRELVFSLVPLLVGSLYLAGVFRSWPVLRPIRAAASPLPPLPDVSGFEWPSLPSEGYVAGRGATQSDVTEGRAVFSLAKADGPCGEPLPIEVPQYALWFNAERQRFESAVVLQAERSGSIEVVGLRISDGSHCVATLPELHLLGRSLPGVRS